MAIGSINTSGISVDSNGRLTVSGFSSGIDWKSLLSAQMTAKRVPAVRIETKITQNNALVSEYGVLKGKVSAVTTALDALRGAPGSTTDVFKTKTASGTTAPTDTAPGSHVPSAIDSLILASIGSGADSGTHTITIHQLAQAHQIRGDSFSANNSALTGLGVTAGTFTVNGENVVVDSDDTLLDVRNKINNAGAGVTATIVSADSSTHYLVLTAADTGTANEITLGGDGATLDSLGLTTGGGAAIQFELKEARNAIIDVNGITGIERSGNEIDDVISGVTFSLLKAEADTEITLTVAPDLSAIKGAIDSFVGAYNDLRAYYGDQRTAKDRNDDGTIDDNEFGVLAYDRNLRDAVNKLSELVSTNVEGAADGFQALSQIGVVVNQDFSLRIDDAVIDSKLLTNVDEVRKLFVLDTSVSDSRVTVLGRGTDTASGTYYLNVAGTNASGEMTGANLQTTAGPGAGGAYDGSLTLNGKSATATDSTAAEGLSLFFNGGVSAAGVDGIAITVSRGLADSFYDYFNDLTKPTSGQLDTRMIELQMQNKDYQDRVDTIDTRLETVRTSLEAKYVAMETALAQLSTIQSTLENYLAQINKSQ